MDIMISGDPGWQVAEYVRGNYAPFGVGTLIYSQQIWSVDRAGEGGATWRTVGPPPPTTTTTST